MRSFFADMRRAGYDIGTSKAELARLMERALLQLEPGTPDLKAYVLIFIGSFSTATLSHPYGAPDLGRGTTAWYEFGPETHECWSSGMSWGTPRTPTVPGLQPLVL